MKIHKRLRPHLTTSNLIACVALFAALGLGTAVAASKLKPNAVKSKHIKNGAVKTPELADGAVTTPKVGDGAVTTPKLGDGSVNSAKVADGSITRADASLGTLVTAYARINNPAGGGNAQIAPGSAVNVPDIDVINEAAGNFIVTFNGLPGNSVANCTIIANPVFSPSTLGNLSEASVSIATGGGSLSASSAQLQTLNGAGVGGEADFYVQVSCPPS